MEPRNPTPNDDSVLAQGATNWLQLLTPAQHQVDLADQSSGPEQDVEAEIAADCSERSGTVLSN